MTGTAVKYTFLKVKWRLRSHWHYIWLGTVYINQYNQGKVHEEDYTVEDVICSQSKVTSFDID
jgi:hypothetical protein